MEIGATEAASLLGVTPTRVRQFLKQGRIEGAEKINGRWVIPLYNGMPKITQGTRGPEGTWRKRPRRAETFIHVDQKALRQNKKNGTALPVVLVKQGPRKTERCHEVEILGPSRLVYRPNQPKHCGACLWIEIDPTVQIVTKLFSANESRSL